jgi:hypothetical protein
MASKSDFGAGAQVDSPDLRDYQVSFDAATPSPVDWTKSPGYPCPEIVDQGQSDCCVAAACSYFQWQLRGDVFSRRDLFSRIANPTLGDGAEIREGFKAIVNQGQALLSEVPDPDIETCQNMRNSAGTSAEELPWKEFNSFAGPNDIDSVARLILLYKGVVMGLYVSVYNWFSVNMEVPDPPNDTQMQDLQNQIGEQNVLKHALYFFDFHMHDDGNGNTEKCIIGSTSWKWDGTVHHIRKSYFDAQATFCPWTFLPSSAVASVLQKVSLRVTGGDAGAPDVRPMTLARLKALKKAAKKATKKVVAKKASKKAETRNENTTAKKTAAKNKTNVSKGPRR